MIRVNIHFRRSTLNRLDEIKGCLQKTDAYGWRLLDLTRADLIRFAVAQGFGLKYPYIHVDKEILLKNLKKALKKSASSKGV